MYTVLHNMFAENFALFDYFADFVLGFHEQLVSLDCSVPVVRKQSGPVCVEQVHVGVHLTAICIDKVSLQFVAAFEQRVLQGGFV